MPNLSKLRYASPRSSTLADDLRGAAHGYLQASGDHRYADAGLIAKGLFLAICAVLFYAAMVTAASPVVFVLAYLGFPFFAMLLAMNVLHDGAHRALSPWAWLDSAMIRLTAIPLGIEPAYWTVRRYIGKGVPPAELSRINGAPSFFNCERTSPARHEALLTAKKPATVMGVERPRVTMPGR